MKKTFVLSTLAITGLFIATHAQAQPYNFRGEPNGWGETALIDDLDGTYSLTITGAPNSRFNFKIAENDWASSWPGSDARSVFDAAGNFTVHFIPGAVGDGWNPLANRVGYDDPGVFGWSVAGDFNGFADANMIDQGSGLYTLDYNIATAGTYGFKFKESGSWDISIGDDFGNSAANNSITTLADNTVVTFKLDLPNGRWTTIVPEPTTLALAGLGLAALLTMRRRS